MPPTKGDGIKPGTLEPQIVGKAKFSASDKVSVSECRRVGTIEDDKIASWKKPIRQDPWMYCLLCKGDNDIHPKDSVRLEFGAKVRLGKTLHSISLFIIILIEPREMSRTFWKPESSSRCLDSRTMTVQDISLNF